MTTTARREGPPPTRRGRHRRAHRSEQLSHREVMVVLVGVMAGMLLGALDQSIVGTALPRIVGELGGLAQLPWVVTAYLLTSTAVTPLWGKVSDLYGRRVTYQAAIGVFMLGSALAAFSRDIGELIAFRAVQGVGGGGLMALAFSIVADLVPPRERGRYQGYFGAVFALASVAGPLLGGWFTDGPGWRWIFWINLPVGAVSLVVTSFALRVPVVRREHRIDYLGAGLIVAAVSSLLLYLDWAGTALGWGAPASLALLTAFALLTTAFVLVELRATEPIIPMRLFRNPVFRTGNLYGFLVGAVMFGGIVFLPLYFQAVMGMSPTRSGLAMLPVVTGITATSVLSGQLTTRTGRYKAFPVVGASLLTVSLLALSRLEVETPYWQVALFALCFGAGLGCTTQTIVTAVQNAVEPRDLGTATSSAAFFRQMGAAIGTAALGAVLAHRLDHHLVREVGGAFGALPGGAVQVDRVELVQYLPEPLRYQVRQAFAHAVDDVFLAALPVMLLALLAALLLKEVPLASGPSRDRAAVVRGGKAAVGVAR